MSYYLKYTEDGRGTMWYLGNLTGWKSANIIVMQNFKKRPKQFSERRFAERHLSRSKGLMQGEFEIVMASSGSILAEAVKDSVNGECIFPACQDVDPDLGCVPVQTLAITYRKGRGSREVFMRKDLTTGNKIWLSMRELREAGDLPKQFLNKEAINNVENAERNRHVDTGGHYHGVVTEDMIGMTWKDTAISLAGMLNQIADEEVRPNAAKSAWMRVLNDLQRQAGEVLDLLQMRNEDEDD